MQLILLLKVICKPHTQILTQLDPAGTYFSWKAAATGKNAKFVREFLEKKYQEDMDRDAAVKLAVQALLEVVDSGESNMDLVVLSSDGSKTTVSEEELKQLIAVVEAEKEAEGSAPVS